LCNGKTLAFQVKNWRSHSIPYLLIFPYFLNDLGKLTCNGCSWRSTPTQPISVPNLTDILFQKLPEGLQFDTKVKNFGMRVGKSRKTWVVVKGENRTKITLGHYPDISLSEVRKLALDAIRTPTWSKPCTSFPDATTGVPSDP
jgi:hypothetical protein